MDDIMYTNGTPEIYETVKYPGDTVQSPINCKSAFTKLLKDKYTYGIRMVERKGKDNSLCIMSYEKLREPTSETPIIYRTYIYGFQTHEVIIGFFIILFIYFMILIDLYFSLKKKWKKNK